MTLLLAMLGCAQGPSTVDSAEPTWTADVKPILDRACVRCHVRGGPMYGGVELDEYDAAAAAAIKNTCTAITPELALEWGDVLIPLAGDGDLEPCSTWEIGSMPPGATSPLTPDEQLTLVRWVAAGTPW